MNSLFHVGERYAGFRRGYNGLVADLGARGFFDHEPVLAVRAPEHEDLEVRDSNAPSDVDVNFWSEFAQKEALNPKLAVRGFSDDLKVRDSSAPSDKDVNFWSEFAQKEALNPQLAVRGFSDRLEARDSSKVSDADINFWSDFAEKETLNPQLAVREFSDEDLESRDLDDGESEIEMRDGLDELYYEYE